MESLHCDEKISGDGTLDVLSPKLRPPLHFELEETNLQCLESNVEDVEVIMTMCQDTTDDTAKKTEDVHVDDMVVCESTFAPTQSCLEHDELLLSYDTGAASNGGPPTLNTERELSMAAAVSAEDKKLQYTLRSNPKRSRRFLDPDYTLEFLPSSSMAVTCPASSTLTGPMASGGTMSASAITATTTAIAPAAPPSKKTNSLLSEKARACTECGKQFPSWKALFGHMRCHPERQWRGIQPPTSVIMNRDRSAVVGDNIVAPAIQLQHMNHAITQAGGDAAPMLNKCAPPPTSFWDQSDSENMLRAHPRVDEYDVEESDTESIEAAYMNGRDQDHQAQKAESARGRRSKHSLLDVVCASGGDVSECNTPPDDVMDELDMADCLVMLAFAAKSKAEDGSDGDSGLPDWKHHGRPPPLMETRDTRKMEIKEKKSLNGRRLAQKSIHFLQEGESMPEKWEDGYEKGVSDRKSKFECNTCKKTFRSHQALGGHRASHKKVKGCFARTNAVEEAAMLDTSEMTSIALTMATTVQTQLQQQPQEVQEEGLPEFDAVAKPDQEELQVPPAAAPGMEEMSMGQFLQFSISSHEKLVEDDHQHDSAMTMEKVHFKHQTSSCSSSSSIIAATAAAGTLLMHHHAHQQPQQPKIHQCTICQRIFATGQALGGHKRCHWGGNGAPESGRKCPLMRPDIEGAANCLALSTSERSSELSRKGRQDSGSYASGETWVNAPELSKKGKQESVASCNDMKMGNPTAQNWLGEYVNSDKGQVNINTALMGGHMCQENQEDTVMQHNWMETLPSKSKPSKIPFILQGGGHSKGPCLVIQDGGAAQKVFGREWIASDINNKSCEGNTCNNAGHAHWPAGGGTEHKVTRGPLPPPTAIKLDELLDLNLPARAEEEESSLHASGDNKMLPPAPPPPPPPPCSCLSTSLLEAPAPEERLPEGERVAGSAGS